MSTVADLLRFYLSMLVTAPTMTLAATWMGAVGLLRRTAKSLGIPAVWVWAGPLAVVWLLHKKKRTNVAGWVLAAAWLIALWLYPSVRYAVGFAAPVAVFFGGLVWLAQRYPHLDPPDALRCALLEWRHREVLTEAVPAAAGNGARVVSTRAVDGGIEAEVIGPAGMSHPDLLAALRDTLAESVLAISGKPLEHLAVVGNGARGSVLVRCLAASPYKQIVSLEDL